MGIKRFLSTVQKHQKLGLDSAVLIYHIESVEPYSNLTTALFDWIGSSKTNLFLSSLIWTEILAKPYKDRNSKMVLELERLLQLLPNTEWIPVGPEIAKEGARLRGVYGLRTPDAIIIASAILSKVSGLITNDKSWSKVKKEGMEIIVLENFFEKLLPLS